MALAAMMTKSAVTAPAVQRDRPAVMANAMTPALRSAVRTARMNGYATSMKPAVTASVAQRTSAVIMVHA